MSKPRKFNALKHGVYSHIKLLPGESCEEFEELHRAVYEEFDPQGPVQESKADGIAENLWRKRQWEKWYSGRNTKPAQKELKRIDEDIQTLTRFVDGVRDGKSVTEVCLPRREHAVLPSLFPREDYDSEKAYLKAMADYIVNVSIGEYQDERDDVIREKVVGAFYSPDAIARQLAIEERLDGKIDKDVLSLGRLKTMQDMIFGGLQNGPIIEHEPVKQIDVPAQVESTQSDQPTTVEVDSSPVQPEGAEPPNMEVVDSPPIATDSVKPSTTGTVDSPPVLPNHAEPPTTEPVHSPNPDVTIPPSAEFAGVPPTESGTLPPEPPTTADSAAIQSKPDKCEPLTEELPKET